LVFIFILFIYKCFLLYFYKHAKLVVAVVNFLISFFISVENGYHPDLQYNIMGCSYVCILPISAFWVYATIFELIC